MRDGRGKHRLSRVTGKQVRVDQFLLFMDSEPLLGEA